MLLSIVSFKSICKLGLIITNPYIADTVERPPSTAELDASLLSELALDLALALVLHLLQPLLHLLQLAPRPAQMIPAVVQLATPVAPASAAPSTAGGKFFLAQSSLNI